MNFLKENTLNLFFVLYWKKKVKSLGECWNLILILDSPYYELIYFIFIIHFISLTPNIFFCILFFLITNRVAKLFQSKPHVDG